jgi:tetratricopeptide (TPR) repeat protein
MFAGMHCHRGEVRYDLFREDEAEADFAEARRRNPAAAAHYLGDMWMRRSKFDRAVREFDALVALRPNDPAGYGGRAGAHAARGDLDAAAADCTTAIRLDPGGPGYSLRAGIRVRQDRPDDALADLDAHVQIHPDDPAAHLNRSLLLKQRGDLRAALAAVTAAHALAPDHPILCNSLAWFLATCTEGALRDGARAVALARRACEATEWKSPMCIDTLAACYADTGAFDEAVRWQTKAVEMEPGNEGRRERLALYRERRACRE